jgi:uncharacterized protein
MSEDLSQALEDADLDELHELLLARADSDGLMLDGVHGLVSALAVGPELVPPDEWMPLVLGEDQPFATLADAQRLLNLVARLYNGVVADLEAAEYEPILGEVDADAAANTTTLTARGWCEGFNLGVDLRGPLWEARMQHDPRLLELLGPVLQLAADEGVFANAEGEEPEPLSAADYDAALRALPKAVADVQQYWREQPPTADEREAAALPESDPSQPPRRRGGHWLH